MGSPPDEATEVSSSCSSASSSVAVEAFVSSESEFEPASSAKRVPAKACTGIMEETVLKELNT